MKGVNQIESENVSAKALDKDSVPDSDGMHRKMGHAIHSILKPFIRLFEWSCDYDGFLALPVKSIPFLMFFGAIFSPWVTMPFFIWAGLSLGVPGCYVVYVLFWAYFVLCHVGAAIIGYISSR